MTWDQINDWFDNFYKQHIEGKTIIRGSAWSGGHIRIWDRNTVSIVLYDPYLRGNDAQTQAVDFIKKVFDPEHQEIHAEITFDRFKKIIMGEDQLMNEDWVRNDE